MQGKGHSMNLCLLTSDIQQCKQILSLLCSLPTWMLRVCWRCGPDSSMQAQGKTRHQPVLPTLNHQRRLSLWSWQPCQARCDGFGQLIILQAQGGAACPAGSGKDRGCCGSRRTGVG